MTAICHDCAIAKGAREIKGHVCTMSMGLCTYCKEEKVISGTNDYQWPLSNGKGFHPIFKWGWD